MAGFFSKASSFLNSQAEHDSPSPAPSQAADEKPSKPASSGGYGELFSGAEALMQKAAKSKHEENPTDVAGDTPHKVPSSGSGGYGDLLASAQSMMGSAKVSDGDQGKVAHGGQKVTKSGEDAGYGDVMASAQVLMGAAKKSKEGAGAQDMGEVAGAAANLIDAASRYGNLEKSSYGNYADKAETYLRDYEASHGSKAAPGSKPAEAADDHTVLPAAGKDHHTGTHTARAVDKEGKAEEEAAPPRAPQETPLKSNYEGSEY